MENACRPTSTKREIANALLFGDVFVGIGVHPNLSLVDLPPPVCTTQTSNSRFAQKG